MSIDARVITDVLQIKIIGRFDFSAHAEFREASRLASTGITKIEIDLSTTEYMDSSALGMLLVLRDLVGGNKNAITIRNARHEVKKILEIANFDKLFNLV